MKNKNGFQFDFLIFSALMLVSCVIIFVVGYLMQRNERFNAMQYLVTTIGSSAQVYDFQTGFGEDKIYLSRFIDNGLLKKVINPFNTEEYCDVDTSYVYKKEEKFYVTLKCGNYSVKDYAYLNSDKMVIYKKNGLGETSVKILSVKGE